MHGNRKTSASRKQAVIQSPKSKVPRKDNRTFFEPLVAHGPHSDGNTSTPTTPMRSALKQAASPDGPRPASAAGKKVRHRKTPRKAAMGVAWAVTHWAWRALPRRHVGPCPEPEEDLPASMKPEVPRHSRWLWNFGKGNLHWRSTPRNPVEHFYETSLGERALKRKHGVFGKRYTKYPNKATKAVPEDGKGIFQRATAKVVDHDEKKPRRDHGVTIDDVKEVAEHAVGQFFPTAYGRRRFSQISGINRFLLSMIEYFHHYFNERKLDEVAKQNNCLVYDQAGRAERVQRMRDCKLEAARCYAKFILGRDMPFHHTNCGSFGSISATSADRQFWEALYSFTIQVVWITFARPDVTVIMRELGRIFRGLYFDPARREGTTPVYRTGDLRRNAVVGAFHSRAKQRRSDVEPRPSEADNTQEMASTNYLAMSVAISRVYGVYACPPMPPKPIYGLLNNRSVFVNLLLSDDPNRPKGTKHIADRSRIGILGYARELFDDNLDPIDVMKEKKYKELKFLGPISEREQVTRVASVAPYLLQPTPPGPSDLERFT